MPRRKGPFVEPVRFGRNAELDREGVGCSGAQRYRRRRRTARAPSLCGIQSVAESCVPSAWNVVTAVAGVRVNFEVESKNSVDREIAGAQDNVEIRRGVDVDELRSLVARRSSLHPARQQLSGREEFTAGRA